MDYTKTYVRVTSQEEYTKAIEFYKSKGFNKNVDFANWGKHQTYYIGIGICNVIIGRTNITFLTDITEEVLGGKKPIEIPENTAVKVESKEEFDILMEAYDRMGWEKGIFDKGKFENGSYCIDLRYKYQYATESYQKYIGFRIISLDKALEILGMEDLKPKKEIVELGRHGLPKLKTRDIEKYLKNTENYTFIPSQPKKMTNIIDTELFERFLKSKKTQVLDSIEKAEENIEEYDDLIDVITTFILSINTCSTQLRLAYNNQDKKLINKYLKELQEMNKTLEDPLFEQYKTVIKSINKFLSKKDK